MNQPRRRGIEELLIPVAWSFISNWLGGGSDTGDVLDLQKQQQSASNALLQQQLALQKAALMPQL